MVPAVSIAAAALRSRLENTALNCCGRHFTGVMGLRSSFTSPVEGEARAECCGHPPLGARTASG